MNAIQMVPFQEVLAEPLRNGLYKAKEFHGRGTKVVNMKELFACDRISDQPDQRVELTEPELDRFRLIPGDLLFARRSFVLEGAGKCSVVVVPSELTTFESSLIRARVNRELAEPLYFYYLFKSRLGRGLMASIATRTAVSGIRGSSLSALRVPIPTLSVQRSIASILGAYDALIENCARRMQILEEMSRAIYREWFVEFRFPGQEGVPMIESDLGWIPQGWSAARLGDLFKVVLGGTPARQRADYWTDGDIAWINSGKVNDFRVIEPSERITREALQNSSTKLMPRGTTLVAITGATLGEVSYLEIEASANQSVVGVFDPDDKQSEMIYLAISNQIESIIAKASGGAQQHINKSVVEETCVLVPPLRVSRELREVLRPMFDLIANLTRTAEDLRRTRDFLLPRLVSGEADVSGLDIDTSGLVE